MFGLKKRFLNYLNKEGFDHTKGNVDPFEYHSSFFMFAKVFSVMDLEEQAWWMYIAPKVVAFTGAWSISICVYSIYMYLPDFKTKYDIIIEVTSYLLVFIYKSIIIRRCFTKKRHYHFLFQALKEDFEYVSNNEGKNYRERFFKNQKSLFKACFLVGIFTMFIGNGIILYSFFILFWAAITKQPRILPFPLLWYWGNVNKTPYYEFMFIQCVWFTMSHTYTYVFYIVSQTLWVGEIICRADLCVWKINDLLVDVPQTANKIERERYSLLIKHRLREIVKIHHSMIDLLEHYAACYKICLLSEQKLSSPIICLTAFGTAEKLEVGEVPMILILLCLAVIVVVYIPSYLCTFLSEKTHSVGEAWMDIPFWEAAKIVRPYGVVMSQRSMRQLPIQSAGFENISLQTYANLLSRAYQWFTLLRQANFNK